MTEVLNANTPNNENDATNVINVDVDELLTDFNVEIVAEEEIAVVSEEATVVEQVEIPEIETVDNSIIPVNNAVLVNETTIRFSAAAWADKVQDLKVLIIGVGGIGSWTALLISRLNPNRLILQDMDNVDTVNLAGQFYDSYNKGMAKVTALKQHLYKFSNYYNVSTTSARFTASSVAPPIVICGFDNMVARRDAFIAWKRTVAATVDKSICLFIDGRLAAEELQVFCMTGNDDYYIKKYEEEFLFSDEEAEPTVCSYKQTSFMANMIGGFITNLFVNYVTNLTDPSLMRSLPFLTTYDAEYMIFKTEQ